MRTVYLLRHAKSSWSDSSLADHDRPLNARGERAAKSMGGHFKKHGVKPSIILCSSAVRTRQTLDHLLEKIGSDHELCIERELYGATEQQLRGRLRSLDDRHASVLLIGHNPGIEQLALGLASGSSGPELERMERKFPTAALAELQADLDSWSELPEAQWRLLSFTTPQDLA